VHWGLTPEERRLVWWDISWIWGPPEDHLALLLETIGATDEAAAIDRAVLKAVSGNQVTPDIGGRLGTREAGDFIATTVLQ
jgi:hypothetical protein